MSWLNESYPKFICDSIGFLAARIQRGRHEFQLYFILNYSMKIGVYNTIILQQYTNSKILKITIQIAQ